MVFKIRRIGVYLIVGTAIAGAVGINKWKTSRLDEYEETSALKLRALGAVVGMDTARKHVINVNLNTIPDPVMRARGLELLNGLHELTSLDVRDTKISTFQCSAMANLRNLQSLVLTGCDVREKDLERMSSLSNLQALYLTDMSVSRISLGMIGRLRALKILDLSASKVDGGLEAIARLPNLEWLLLRDINLIDDSLSVLSGCPKLKRITMTGTKCNPASIAALKSKIAGLAID